MVPLLVVWMAYGEREATGTSLMAIILIAAVGVATSVGYGNVHPAEALVVGAPAVVGVVAGTALQQRMPERAIAGFFAVLLVISAVLLVAQ